MGKTKILLVEEENRAVDVKVSLINLGYEIIEVPISYRPRYGEEKVRFLVAAVVRVIGRGVGVLFQVAVIERRRLRHGLPPPWTRGVSAA